MCVYYFLFEGKPFIDLFGSSTVNTEGQAFYYPSESRWIVPGTVSVDD